MYPKFIWVSILILLTSLLKAQNVEYGEASYYADKFNGRLTANGEIFDNKKLTAAHNTLPFNTVVKVTNQKNNKSVIVRVNDRGPFAKGRIIDLSKAAASEIDMLQDGTAKVKLEIHNGSTETTQNPPLATNNLFEVTVKKMKEGRFAIQVASYQYVENMLNEIVNIQEEYGDNTLVHVSQVNGIRVYRVILGPYETREKTEKKLEKLKRKNKDGFIIDLNHLK